MHTMFRSVSGIAGAVTRATRAAHRSDGQALALLGAGMITLLGFVAMSIDVGRLVWARTQIQSAVDASALAAAQSMPDQADASTQATTYWATNGSFIIDQGRNVQFAVSFPGGGNKAVQVRATADIPTWFARFVGLDHWQVSAEAQSEAQVVDAVLVLDRSGSMCWDSHGPDGNYVSRVKLAAAVTASQTTFPVSKSPSVALARLSDLLFVGQVFRLEGSAASEWMRITSIDDLGDSIDVVRAVPSTVNGAVYPATNHMAGRSIRGNDCQAAGAGPYHPWEEVKTGGDVFVSEFNPRYDRIGFVHFSTAGSLQSPLTGNLPALQSSIAGAPDPTTLGSGDGRTNIAHGFYLANEELITGARGNARRVVVLLSDGVANTHCTPSTATRTCSSWGTNNGVARQEALRQADYAAANGITVYTIGYGSSSDDALMDEIAARTGGKFYKAPDASTLQQAFLAIARDTRISLTR